MKKRMISSIMLIMFTFILGVSSRVLATNQTIANEDIPITNVVINVPTQISNNVEGNIQTPWTNSVPEDYINNISNQLQDMASKQPPKDTRRQVTVMVIVIITVLLIVGLITWYYMTNQ